MNELLIWLFFGMISAFIAKIKGRKGWQWFLLGTVFGPFGLILAFVLPERKH